MMTNGWVRDVKVRQQTASRFGGPFRNLNPRSAVRSLRRCGEAGLEGQRGGNLGREGCTDCGKAIRALSTQDGQMECRGNKMGPNLSIHGTSVASGKFGGPSFNDNICP